MSTDSLDDFDLEKIEDSPHLLDILLQMEDTLDSLDIYVFRNWSKGEVVEGPKVFRYWLDMTLKYPWNDMPDPRAGLRLLKHGIRVYFQKAREERRGVASADAKLQQADTDDPKAHIKTDKIWLVHISMPRRLVSQIASAEIDFYDDDVDVEDVEDAKDSGIDDESAYQNEETADAEEGTAAEDPNAEEEMNAQPPR